MIDDPDNLRTARVLFWSSIIALVGWIALVVRLEK